MQNATSIKLDKTVEIFINSLNEQCIEQKLNKYFSIAFYTEKKKKVIKVHCADLADRSRSTIYEKHYEVSVKEQMKGDWKVKAYADFLYEGMVYMLITLSDKAELDKIKTGINYKTVTNA